jgi:hypothetical protein
MVGKTLPKMTAEVFNNIMVNKSLYIIEALRRDSTRNILIEFLGNFNPVYKTTSLIENPNKLQLNSSKYIKQDVYDEFEETDKYWGCSDEELF